MLEPSLIHPGTLGALPDTWKAFVAMFDGSWAQARAIAFALRLSHEHEGPLAKGVEEAIAEGWAAAAAVAQALADALRVERRGSREAPLVVDFPLPGVLGCVGPGGLEAGSAKETRQDADDRLRAARKRGSDAVKKLGSLLLVQDGRAHSLGAS